MQKPRQDIRPNTAEYETLPLVKPTGFREYDARWILEKEINLLGIQALAWVWPPMSTKSARRRRSPWATTSAAIPCR